MNTNDTTNTTIDHSLGQWLGGVHTLLRRAHDRVLEAEGISRRDWRMLRMLHTADFSTHRLRGRHIGTLVERGWASPTISGWQLTETGTATVERVTAAHAALRDELAASVSSADLDTTLRTLETFARTLGWDGESPLPRGYGKARRFGRGHNGRHRGHGGQRLHGHGYGHARRRCRTVADQTVADQ
ncbi:hypothetical protein [Microbacterium sp. YY-01]|uniref:hypothetical protein n=1 Tax=Microbacterium sp. YY-01 TaxID=3421634 RepID=UPI003D17A9F9